MLKKLMSMILLLTIFTSCNEYFVWCDVSTTFNRCRCVCLNASTLRPADDIECEWQNGSQFKSGSYTLSRCDTIGGPYMKDYAGRLKPLFHKLKAKVKNLEAEANQCRIFGI